MTDVVIDEDDDLFVDSKVPPEDLTGITDTTATEAAAAKDFVSILPPAVPPQKDGHLNKIVRDKLFFDRWMHRFSLSSAFGAAALTGALVGVTILAPVAVPAVAATAAGLGAFAVGSSIVRRFAVAGRPRKRYKRGNYVRFGGIFKTH